MSAVGSESVSSISRSSAGLASLSPDGQLLAVIQGEGSAAEACMLHLRAGTPDSCSTVTIDDPRWILWVDEGSTYVLASGQGAQDASRIQTVASLADSDVVEIPGGPMAPLGVRDGDIFGIFSSGGAPVFGSFDLQSRSVTEIAPFDLARFGGVLPTPLTTLVLTSADGVALFSRTDGPPLVLEADGRLEEFLPPPWQVGPNPVLQSEGTVWFRDDLQIGQGLDAAIAGGEPLLSFASVDGTELSYIADRPNHRNVSMSLSPDRLHIVTVEASADAANTVRLSVARTEAVLRGSPTWVGVDVDGECCGSLNEGFEAVRWFGETTIALALRDGSIEILRLTN